LCFVSHDKQGTVHCAALTLFTDDQPTYVSHCVQCNYSSFIVPLMLLLQDYDSRIAALNMRLSQQDTAAVGQQEHIDDLTQRLSGTACEASGLRHQVDILESLRMVCCNTYHLTPVYLHIATLTASRRCYCSWVLVLPHFRWFQM